MTTSYYGSYYGSEQQQQPFDTAFESAFSVKKIRLAFVRKVYGILLLQLAITTAIIYVFLEVAPVKSFAVQNKWLLWLCLVCTVVLILVLSFVPTVRRKFPANIVSLFLFTVSESVLLGMISSVYNEESVLIAAGICTAVTFALMLFACQTKIDFTTFSGMLFVALVVLVIFGVISVMFPLKIVHIIYAALAALVFSLGSLLHQCDQSYFKPVFFSMVLELFRNGVNFIYQWHIFISVIYIYFWSYFIPENLFTKFIFYEEILHPLVLVMLCSCPLMF